MSVEADRDRCIGAGMCVLTAPAVFDQDDEGVVVVLQKDPDGADADAAHTAVGLCPSSALLLSGG